MVKGWTRLSIREELMEKLETMWQEDTSRPKNQKLTPYVENLINQILDQYSFTKEYGYFLKLENVDDKVVLFDNIKNEHITIKINAKENLLICEDDESTNCVHIGYCYGNTKIFNRLIEKGIRPTNKEDKSIEKDAEIVKKKAPEESEYHRALVMPYIT